MRRFVSRTFARTFIQFINSALYAVVRNIRQIFSFRKVFSEKAICIFVRASVPRDDADGESRIAHHQVTQSLRCAYWIPFLAPEWLISKADPSDLESLLYWLDQPFSHLLFRSTSVTIQAFPVTPAIVSPFQSPGRLLCFREIDLVHWTLLNRLHGKLCHSWFASKRVPALICPVFLPAAIDGWETCLLHIRRFRGFSRILCRLHFIRRFWYDSSATAGIYSPLILLRCSFLETVALFLPGRCAISVIEQPVARNFRIISLSTDVRCLLQHMVILSMLSMQTSL